MNIVKRIYERLYQFYGPQHWWPGDTPEEVIIGAVLTQNTNWQNVKQAIHNLRNAGLLSLDRIAHISLDNLSQLIRPSGYYNIKAVRLKSAAEFFLNRCRGNLKSLKDVPLVILRRELLQIHGVGEETADSILLYALERPVFVVDAYTRRMGTRHGLFKDHLDYDSVRLFFETLLPLSVPLYNEYHALLVRLGKNFCRPKPLCQACPLYAYRYFTTSGRTFLKKQRNP